MATDDEKRRLRELEAILREWMKEHERLVRWRLWQIAGRLAGQEEDDLFCEVFLRVWRMLLNGEEIEVPAALLLEVARRVALEHLERIGRTPLPRDEPPEREAPGGTPEDGAERREALRQLEALLRAYPDQDKVAAWLARVVDEKTIAEIAKNFGVSESTVKRWVEDVQEYLERHFRNGRKKGESNDEEQ